VAQYQTGDKEITGLVPSRAILETYRTSGSGSNWQHYYPVPVLDHAEKLNGAIYRNWIF